MEIDMTYEVKIVHEVSEEFLFDILTTAAEGGIGYWAIYDVDRAEDLSVTRIHHICDAEDEEEELGNDIDARAVAHALALIAAGKTNLSNYHIDIITKAVADDDCSELDADDCDVIVQVALFDEVVYG